MLESLMVMPILGIIFTLIFAFLLDPKSVTSMSPRVNALVRIILGIFWFVASTILVPILAIAWFINWLIFQLIAGKKGWEIVDDATAWYLEWLETIVYGYPTSI